MYKNFVSFHENIFFTKFLNLITICLKLRKSSPKKSRGYKGPLALITAKKLCKKMYIIFFSKRVTIKEYSKKCLLNSVGRVFAW